VGLEGFVIVDTGDALLICQEDRAQELRQLIDNLKDNDELNALL